MRGRLGTWAAGLRIATFRLRRYALGGSLWAVDHASPLLTGLLLKAVFDRVGGSAPAYTQGLSLLAVLVAAEVGRAVVFWSAMASWPGWWQVIAAWIRSNLLDSVLCAPGPSSTRLPASSGEAVGRFRDDVEDMIWFVDVWVDVVGGVIMTGVALALMLSISWLVTLVVVLPLLGVLAATRGLSRLVRRYHLRMREQGSSVTDLIADLFAGVLVLKAGGAEERALERLRARIASRAGAAVRAQLARDLLGTVSGAGAQISVGLVLLLAAGAMRQGRFTVGDLALFTTYTSAMIGLPRWLGRMAAYQRQAGVALQRLARLQPDRRPEQVLAPRAISLVSLRPEENRTDGRQRSEEHEAPSPSVRFPEAKTPSTGPVETVERLRLLEIRGLTALHPGSGLGIVDVTLAVAAHSLVVVAGSVGAGKTTLLRALLGLIPVDRGSVSWNGAPVDDPSVFLVPPRASYVAQISRIFSASLGENLVLGWPAGPDRVDAALRLAQLDGDVAGMSQGLATVVGPRGSRLSGGQSQRAGIARALVRDPELLVLDDISSALDRRTEERVWAGLREAGATCLAASNRRAALEQADRIVVLEAGRVIAAGTLEQLMEDSPQFHRLWTAELFEEARESPA